MVKSFFIAWIIFLFTCIIAYWVMGYIYDILGRSIFGSIGTDIIYTLLKGIASLVLCEFTLRRVSDRDLARQTTMIVAVSMAIVLAISTLISEWGYARKTLIYFACLCVMDTLVWPSFLAFALKTVNTP